MQNVLFELSEMKKVSVVRANIKPLPAKHLNMKHSHGDQEKNRDICFTDADCMVESQAQYIENLQQQIFVLENEDCHNEMKNMKVDLKRKQTTVDMVRSERDRILRYKEELEEKFRKEKCKLLEELITLRKDKESVQEKNSEVEQLLKDQKQNERNYQEDLDNLKIQMEQTKREKLHDKEIISTLMEEKEKLQKEIFEMKMLEEARPEKGEETIKSLKEKIEELHATNEVSKRSAEHERLLRERLSEDNDKLIRRYAQLESEMAEVKAQLREEEARRSSLEQLHLSTVVEASEAKRRDESMKEEISRLTDQLREESERAHNLAVQLAEEQRFKSREEERLSHLMQRLQQKEEQMKVREDENIELMRDNTYFKDQVLHLKEQIKSREDEVSSLKHKVQDMQISVEEFIQSTQAANRLAGERWKQLGQLAQGITALTTVAEPPDSS